MVVLQQLASTFIVGWNWHVWQVIRIVTVGLSPEPKSFVFVMIIDRLHDSIWEILSTGNVGGVALPYFHKSGPNFQKSGPDFWKSGTAFWKIWARFLKTGNGSRVLKIWYRFLKMKKQDIGSIFKNGEQIFENLNNVWIFKNWMPVFKNLEQIFENQEKIHPGF